MKYLTPKKGRPAMKKALKKLNNRRGASILIALLLFLICALAGAAAITAAASNMGRYEYLIKNQQTYLSVSSAAQLFREGFDGITATATFTASTTEDKIKLQPESEDGKIQITDADFNAGPIEITPADNDKPKLIKDDLEKFVKNAFYTYYDATLDSDELWQIAEGKWTDNTQHDCPVKEPNNKREYTVKIDDADEDKFFKKVTVTMEFTKESLSQAPEELSESNPIDVKITVKAENVEYEMTGQLTAEVKIENADPTIVTKKYTVELADKNPDGTPMTEEREKLRSMVLSSKATVTVKLNLEPTISRVINKDDSEGGGGT